MKIDSKPQFFKVPFSQFEKDWIKLYQTKSHIYGATNLTQDKLFQLYNSIELPTRSTYGSAGYDFKAPFGFNLLKGDSMVIPTGIRCFMPSDMVLLLMPRSGQGFKYRLREANTIGVIDSDYFNADNSGHIMVKLVNEGLRTIERVSHLTESRLTESQNDWYFDTSVDREFSGPFTCNHGDKFIQGIFINYGKITNDEKTSLAKRKGGMGSTNTNKEN